MASCSTLVAIAAVLLGACSGGSAAVVDPGRPDTAPDVAEGRRVFLATCAGCHGARGDGAGAAADGLFPPPRNLTRGEYRFRSTASGTLPTRADLARSIALGLPGSAMPGWRDQLSAHQIDSLVLFLENLSPRFADEPRQLEDVVLAADLSPTAATPAAIAQGKALYVKMGCGECHGAQGRGDGKAAAAARNSDGTVSHVFDFTYGVYKGGHRPVDVYRTFVTGLDGAPMPAFDQSLPQEEDRWALVAYVLSLGRARGLAFYLSERPTWYEPMEDPKPYTPRPEPAPSARPTTAAPDSPAAEGW